MRLLVVEDNRKLAQSLKKGLQQEGYAVDLAFDGVEGEELIKNLHGEFDIVILDIMLPRRDGVTVCRNLRTAGITIPVLMLTARDEVQDRVAGLDAGADDYLPKPFSFDELTARIRALSRRPREKAALVLRAGSVELNTAEHEVVVSGETVPVTLKEYRMLELLMRHPNQVLSREQISSSLWDFEFDGYSNVIDVHVKNLRKKLSEKGNEEFIETIRGVGYRIKG
ncbi:MAG TPA: response regulator transcription factor [Spirochaetia bacterium]|nr:response regulator transcription factor [Spirochaetia bacterium]